MLDLFSGIGAFSLGLERAGMRTAAFCEIDPFCRAVLRKHWPDIPIFDDIRTLDAARLQNAGIYVEVLCGGFPCTNISDAGRRDGLHGSDSALWFEYERLIGELRPRYALIENVAALRSRGLDTVLRGLAALRYDAEWHCVPASAIGAPHQRDRLWIMAYPNSDACGARGASDAAQGTRGRDANRGDVGSDVADADNARRSQRAGNVAESGRRIKLTNGDSYMADADREPPVWTAIARAQCDPWPVIARLDGAVDGSAAGLDGVAAWERDVPRLCEAKTPHRAARVRAIGNSLVPQLAELIGRAVMQTEAAKRRQSVPPRASSLASHKEANQITACRIHGTTQMLGGIDGASFWETASRAAARVGDAQADARSGRPDREF